MKDTRRPLPLTRDLVLVGGGHTHALVLRKWGMTPLPGVRVTLIDPEPAAAYSGMLPGHVAGHYTRDELDIDLVRLCRFAGARFVQGRAIGLDPARREIRVEGAPAIGFDIASLDIGVQSTLPSLMGFAAHAVPAKPLGPFAARWQGYLDDGAQGDAAVIGAGVAGTELAMAMAHRLEGTGRSVHLVEADKALSALGSSTRRRLLTALRNTGVVLHERAEITRIGPKGLTLASGGEIDAAFVVGAAGGRPQDWLKRSGLPLTDGFVAVNARLQSGFKDVYAVGDCAHLTENPRPKAGVYAVRQAPVLFNNLRTALGFGGYRRYTPQSDYLKLVSLGGKSAIGERFGLSLSGPWVWRMKDRIDRRFMHKLSDLPFTQEAPDLPWPRARDLREAMGDRPMCGGCGAKVGRATLQRALARLPAPLREDVRRLGSDDAALLSIGNARQVLTTDHLRALVEDPATMTRIAATHALGDIWAMGASPQAATVNLVLPRLSEPLAARTLNEVLETAADVMTKAGADIVGGHSSVGDELTVGFSITGLCSGDPITLAGARAGDAIILTKGIGSGTILAADMAGAVSGRLTMTALSAMTRSERAASEALAGAKAMTDVTGFGLAGHLQNLCDASSVGAELWLHAVPHLPGALDLAAAGWRSTLYGQNRMVMPDLPETPEIALLFDPQTAGGLLAAVSPNDADAVIDALHAAGYDDAARIGWLTEATGHIDVTD